MKALMLTPRLGCGVDAVTEIFAEEMNRRGHSSDIIYYWPGNKFKFKRHGTSVAEFPVNEFNELLYQIQKSDYDIIHSHSCVYGNNNFQHGNGISRFVNETELPLVYTAHSIIFNDKMHRTEVETGEKVSLEQAMKLFDNDGDIVAQEQHMQIADKVLHLTKYGLSLMNRVYPQHAQKSYVVPNASDFHKFAKDPEVARKAELVRHDYARNGRKIILQSGWVYKTKGVLDTARAFNEVAKNYDSLLIFSGGVGLNLNDLYNTIDSSLHGKFLLTGFIKDKKEMAALYKAADIVVLPTYYESWSLTGAEALQMGTPFAVSDLEGPHEVFVEPGYALGLNAGDHKQIARTIIYAFDHPKEVEERTLKAQEAVTRLYNERVVVDKLARLYQDAIDSHSEAMKDLALAEESIVKAFRLDSKSQHQEAIKHYMACADICEKAAKKSPSLRDARYKKGLALRNIGKLDEAARSFSEGIKIDPNHALSFYDKALTHLQAGNVREYKLNMEIYNSLKGVKSSGT